MPPRTESGFEQVPRTENFMDVARALVAVVVNDCRTTWEASRPDSPEIPFLQEVLGDWYEMSYLRGEGSTPPAWEPLNPITSIYYRYSLILGQIGHTAYHNLARRRVRFRQREREIFEYFNARVDEMKEDIANGMPSTNE